ncbi:atrophin-1-like isoform X2 [Corticium candelabrum]|uniref:atrophin-1-like isoform X2 n=1 Tax=Corticium candelabrum TaxID=121492 RepID=UPI002E26C8E6|nr:atrophin-1-like isoform X2 [Corticium candelabrum]
MVVLAESKPLTARQKAAVRLLILKEREKNRIESEKKAANERKEEVGEGSDGVRVEKECTKVDEESGEKEAQQSAEEKRRSKQETIEQIKKELSHLESRLDELQKEKHQMFLQLKKVLHEDEKRRQDLAERPLEHQPSIESVSDQQEFISADFGPRTPPEPPPHSPGEPEISPLKPPLPPLPPVSASPPGPPPKKLTLNLSIEQDSDSHSNQEATTMDISPQPTTSSYNPPQSTPVLSTPSFSSRSFIQQSPHTQPPFAFYQAFNSGAGFLLSSNSPSLTPQPHMSASAQQSQSQLRHLLQQPLNMLHTPVAHHLPISHPASLFPVSPSALRPGGLLNFVTERQQKQQQQHLQAPSLSSTSPRVPLQRTPSLMSLQPRQSHGAYITSHRDAPYPPQIPSDIRGAGILGEHGRSQRFPQSMYGSGATSYHPVRQPSQHQQSGPYHKQYSIRRSSYPYY